MRHDSHMTAIIVLIVAAASFVLATKSSSAGRMTAPLRRLRDAEVDVRVWGSPLPGSGRPSHRVDSVRAFGAGLLIWLQVRGGEIILLKIAQPKGLRQEGRRVEIAEARYVQWNGVRLGRADGVSALTMDVATSEHGFPR